MPPVKKYLSPKKVAQMLMVSTESIRLWADKGVIKATTTVGGHRRFKIDDVNDFAKENNIDLYQDQDSPLKILIVDDEKSYADMLKERLAVELKDVQIKISLDGFDVATQLLSFMPHIILLDIKMPHLDGFQVCQSIKAGQGSLYADVRVIAISGNASEKEKKRIIKLGAEDCLDKPIKMSDLLNILKRDLDK
ncbi:MAG: excisionase family DNA binding protein [Alteromonadaceae bacterium]|jgi:excisionase family DNA binding protein